VLRQRSHTRGGRNAERARRSVRPVPRGLGRWTNLAAAAFLASLPLIGAACFSRPEPGSLAPTLTMQSLSNGQVAIQDGIAVPTFDYQPRSRLDLSGPWKVQQLALDSDLSLTDRSVALQKMEAAAGGRQQPGFDDSAWSSVDVPGTVDPAPGGSVGGSWYRRTFDVPIEWQNLAVTLKFGAVNYIADVWLNGHYLGYHEGGHTPFAFAVEKQLQFGAVNVLAVRVDTPIWGTRNDIVPWGLTDWWDYGGITQPVWLEASPLLLTARADVVPHLDGADVTVVIENRAAAETTGSVGVEILPTSLDSANLLTEDPRRLEPTLLTPVATEDLGQVSVAGGGHVLLDASFAIGAPDLWTLGRASLYLLHVTVESADGASDQLFETFGLRRIAVDPENPRLLLNGDPVMFAGVAAHPEVIRPTATGDAGQGMPMTTMLEALTQLEQARKASADFIRTDHTPASPALLTLADRLGFAVWEEIPLYHFTPLTFSIAMGRGIPQQMLLEMALRDMNHPSVMFYGLANESTGGTERTDALAKLNGIVKGIDPTRLTGQAAYGSSPSDSTSMPLDVAGYTFYYGVFYGTDPADGTRQALAAAHREYPTKPLMILEFGYWADPPSGQARQVQILQQTGGQLDVARDDRPGGYVGAMVWWSLDDYFTTRPGITVERFGMFAPDGASRSVVAAAQSLFSTAPQAGAVPPTGRTTSGGVGHPLSSSGATARLTGLLAYAVAFALLILIVMLRLALWSGGRPWLTRKHAWRLRR
jgi:beta-galactosidase